MLQSGPWDNHRPNVQGLASLESGLSKNRLAPSDGPSFRVKWECLGLYCKSLFKDLADRDKDVSINHFRDGSALPPVRSLLHTWNATHRAAAAAKHADVHVLCLRTAHRCNMSCEAKWSYVHSKWFSHVPQRALCLAFQKNLFDAPVRTEPCLKF